MKRLLRSGQPLYPPDIVPVAHSSSQQSESDKSASSDREFKAMEIFLSIQAQVQILANPILLLCMINLT